LFGMAADAGYKISVVEKALRELKLDAFLASFIEVTEELDTGTLSRGQLSQKLKEAGVTDVIVRSRVREYLDGNGSPAAEGVSRRPLRLGSISRGSSVPCCVVFPDPACCDTSLQDFECTENWQRVLW
jgi:hypothetical protein